jgi:hypothetical protein
LTKGLIKVLTHINNECGQTFGFNISDINRSRSKVQVILQGGKYAFRVDVFPFDKAGILVKEEVIGSIILY